jgi:hypothetical protein
MVITEALMNGKYEVSIERKYGCTKELLPGDRTNVASFHIFIEISFICRPKLYSKRPTNANDRSYTMITAIFIFVYLFSRTEY